MTEGKSIVNDEVELVCSLVPLEGAKVLELGCGNADFTRKLLASTGVKGVTALEVDRIQHRLNLDSLKDSRLTFGYGAAEWIPFDDKIFDGVIMMKSLHHVPVESMHRAFAEIHRVLKPGGWLYISEPEFAGSLNEITSLFHDERAVRAAAYEAIRRATREGLMREESEHHFDMPVHYAGFEDFVSRHVEVTHSTKNYTPDIASEVRRRFDAHLTPRGADFMKPMRVNVLRRI
jgi:ubiquinone/menaquinone biosynthesis C-methylase UbiE